MTNQEPTYKDKLQNLRCAMKEQGVDGFIVPRADEYQGEFLAAYAQRLPRLTGFTGSAGVAVILEDRAVVLTDARYIIQVKQQVDEALYKTGNTADISAGQWLAENCSAGEAIGYDPWLHTPEQIETIEAALEGRGVELRAINNLVDTIWEGQPDKPASVVRIFPNELAGTSSEDKRKAIGQKLEQQGIYASVLSLPDSICWLLNVRGDDVDYIPLLLSTAIIDQKGRVQWFIEESRNSDDVRGAMGGGVEIAPPEDLAAHLELFADQKIGVDYKRSPLWFKTQLEAAGAKVVDFKDPCILPKSLKSEAEQNAIRRAHIHDGVALVQFLHWLDIEAPKGKITELDVADKLLEYRSQSEDFRGLSFPVIAGFGANGAIVHYRATQDNHAVIKPPGLLLVDSGGQYVGGTTDITRTMVVGSISDEARDNFTRVLKGHIAIASAELTAGTTGIEIDALARAPLKEAGLDYAHGTGHGVGCYLAVHEEAANFSPKGKDAPQPGMLISNEPGYYKEGEYGIRIESLVLVKDIGSGKIGFETVSMAPIDRRAINKDMMDEQEVQWLNDYHKVVWETLEGLLEAPARNWLQEQTRSL